MNTILSSEYIGITSLPEIEKTDSYFKLENTLKMLYEYYKKNRDTNKYFPEMPIYKYMQGVDDKHTDWNYIAGKDMDFLLESFKQNWSRINSDNSSKYWYFVNVQHEEKVFILDAVKIYVSVIGNAVKDLFSGAIKEMLLKAKYSFDAKISKYVRKDTMCFWIHGDDFSVLEDYFSCKQELLATSLEFIPYRNKLGVCRELSDNSYNHQIAILITDYFRSLPLDSKVSLVQMYSFFLDAWLGKHSCEPDKYSFMDAQSLIVILEILDVLLDRHSLTDNHVLLSSDQKFWRPLYKCKNWEEYNELCKC